MAEVQYKLHMVMALPPHTICWRSTWSPHQQGLEHVLLTHHAANSIVLGLDESGRAFRLQYALQWNDQWQLRQADLQLLKDDGQHRRLRLHSDGAGSWEDGDGRPLPDLNGCIDVDIWPTPLTNSFPLWRTPLRIGARRLFRMAWVDGLSLCAQAQAQAYTRLGPERYLFESLDGSGFKADLELDADGIVLDYPGWFQRVQISSADVDAKGGSGGS